MFQDQYKVLCINKMGREWIKWIFSHDPQEAEILAKKADDDVLISKVIGIHKSF